VTAQQTAKLMSLLGLAQKAGRIISGDQVIEKALRDRKIKLLLIAADAAENTCEKYSHLAEACRIEWHLVLTKEELGQAVGKQYRAAVGINDEGFGRAMAKILAGS
jgi:ribosomal protein L7Ae-like RNA K-turn-binding protein